MTSPFVPRVAPTEKEMQKAAAKSLWTTESKRDEPFGQEPLPRSDRLALTLREHGYYGCDPVEKKPGDMGDLSIFRQQYQKIQGVAYTLAPTIMATDIERHLEMNDTNNIFNATPRPSKSGLYMVPSHTQWGHEIQKATKLRRWIDHFKRFGIIICHRISIPSEVATQNFNEKQVTLTNPGGETVVWNDAESPNAESQMVSPVRVMMADPQIFKIDCETDTPGVGYQVTPLPNTISAQRSSECISRPIFQMTKILRDIGWDKPNCSPCQQLAQKHHASCTVSNRQR